MQREGELAGIFTVLLFGVVWPTGCHNGGYAPCNSPFERSADPGALAEALKDDVLSESECIALCTPEPTPPPDPQPTTGATADTCVDSGTIFEPGTSTGTGTNTGTDSGTGTSTGTDSGTGTSTGTDSGTGTGSSTDAGTDSGSSTGAVACTAPDATASAGTDTAYDPGPLYTCKPIEGSLASLTCYFEDCAYGRRPAGLRSGGRAVTSHALGRLFAEGAHLEAASVPAFERLAAALTAHGAPASLCARALAAAADERRHAAQMTALAALFDATPATLELDAVAAPTLLELARDNAIQGCVGETWAALLARHQADTAELPQIRAAMTEIAADETEHAELAWAIDAWLHTILSVAEQTEVLTARAEACDSLRRHISAAIDHPAQRTAGLPRRSTALALHDGLRRALWGPSLPHPAS